MKTKYSVLGLLVIFTLLLVATAPVGAQEKVKLVWWAESHGDEDDELFSQLFKDSFEEAHPDVELEIIWYQPQELDRVLRTAVTAGAGPDLIHTPGPSFVLEYVNAGYILLLDEYAEKFGWAEKIYPWAIDIGKVEDKLYSMPMTYETMVFFYDKTLFDEQGWEPPTNREELEALAEKTEDMGMVPFAHSTAWHAAGEWYVGMFYSNYVGAGNVYRALTQEIQWDDPLFVESIELLNDYMQRGWFAGDFATYSAIEWDTHVSMLCDGTAGMKMEGTWVMNFLPDYCGPEHEAHEWDWAPLPILREGVTLAYDLGIGFTLSINAKSEHPDEVAEVINWFFADRERAAKIMAALPTVYDVPIYLEVEDFPPDIDPRYARLREALSEASAGGNYGYTTWTFWPAKTDAYIYEGIDDVFGGKITPLEFCQEQQKLFAEELAEGKIPPIPLRELE